MTTKYSPNRPADMTLPDLRRFAERYQLEIGTHSPGDGVRRIQFIYGRGQNKRIVHTALGIREAEIYLRGYMTGYDNCESPRKSFNENPPKIIHRAGRYKVYWNSEEKEFHVTDGPPSDSFGYYTNDKQDAIDTAEVMAGHGPARNPVKDRHPAMYPQYRMDEWTYKHLIEWLSTRAPIPADTADDPTEVKRLASQIQSWLERMSQEDGEYLVGEGWPKLFDEYVVSSRS